MANEVLDIAKTINDITDEDGIKVKVGFETKDILLMGAIFLVAGILVGVAVGLINSKITKNG